jgi:multiple sugar transport system permease protein
VTLPPAPAEPELTPAALPRARPRLRLLDREAPLGYFLVLPAIFYLAIFIAYPFFMSLYMSFTDAQAGNQKWTFVGGSNYSKIESYEIHANDFVLISKLARAEAERFVDGKAAAKVTTAPSPKGFRALLDVGGRTIPILQMPKEADAAYLGSTIASDLDWKAEEAGGSGGTWRVVAHAADSPVTFGPFVTRAELDRGRTEMLLVPARMDVRTNGKGVVQDPNFLLALKNTFKYTFGTEIIKLLIGVPCALLLNRRFRGRRLLRGLVVIPWVIPIAISAQAWLWILDSSYSVINWCLVHWGILSPAHIINFRGDKNWAMLSVIAVNVWRGFPFTAIVILAGLTAIPDEILERARLDGANGFQRFVHVISPMIRPILLVSLLFSIIFSFSDFNTIWIITKGGPYDQTQVLSTYAYQVGVNSGFLGRGAAISLFMFPIMAIMVFFMLRFLRKEA